MTREEAVRRINRAAEENLTELDLAGLELEDLPPEIGKCTQLEKLVLGKYDEEKEEWVGNKLTEFPDVVFQLTNLKILSIAHNQIKVIPEAIGQLFNLTWLYLGGNQITVIPEFIGQLSNLTHLNLHTNQIKVIPEAIGQLSNLTELILYNNQITVIAEAIEQLSNLTELYLGGNQITVIPEAIGQLSNLTELSLSYNQITVIPDAIAKLSNLTQLYLSSNQIAQLPDAIGQLSNLTQLYLFNNQITQLPDAMGQLSNLTQLDLRSNQIAQIPDAIGQLSNLTQLDLRRNQIAQIPDVIGQLSNLTHLDLNNNQIAAIPEAIRSMEKLEKLDLRGNPMPIPREIMGGSRFGDPGDLRTILDFYFLTRDPNDTEELNEAKLLIVGEGEAGKTSLAKKLLNPDYELEKQEPSTEGINVIRWEFPQANGKPFRVHLWDFGGQEIYHATHQFFLTERSLYILLVDNRRENPNLCYWLNIIELLSKSSPVFLVQNEKQDICCEINLSQQRRDFANLEKDFATNLASNRGLAALQRALQNRISNLDHISTPIPKRWANVRHILENYSQRQTHIEISEFYNICAGQGFKKSDKPAMLSLSKYLHDLGIILHFQKDPILKNIVILRPELATNAVYKVISKKEITDDKEVADNAEVIANCGYFTQKNLKQIWYEREYQDLHDELLQLMKHFKLCYEIPGQPGQYIAPQLLPLATPDYNWDDIDNLILRYEYDFMPKGIITRFIVEMHLLIYRPQSFLPKGRGDIVWRDGVILTDGYGKAEVIEDYHKREIRIRVSGKQKKSILERIRHELWKIHNTYDDRLKYKELIPCNCPECNGSLNSHLYDFDALRRRLEKGKYEVECQKSYEMVNVCALIEDFPDYSQQREKERVLRIDPPDRVDASSFPTTINNIINMTQDSPKNQFNAPVSGVVANEKAEVTNSTFIQNNNPNTAEILKLISSMRETAAQFPEDIREGVIIDIEDVETEVNKPEDQWSKARLKKSLTALVALAGILGTGVGGAIDIANNAIDLGEKVGIELKLPSAQ
ncbi:leucine-rich repeat domain-containing protein [Lyngbya sp. CCAP 1446/10]|uniref:leucine-rich repeat domain-containing protein n=1 Tax=Lyngbya sp. CCAP 1446/10 TaxID=439293 RepID=UPI002236FD2B|nr:COR domain-containing protein [Lyngbya sp. CCAP 1446/10]MCW6048986.1 leucine-rich repeat domain-containing protein [Lyngbya sp. CCAP 1446/10]